MNPHVFLPGDPVVHHVTDADTITFTLLDHLRLAAQVAYLEEQAIAYANAYGAAMQRFAETGDHDGAAWVSTVAAYYLPHEEDMA